MDTQKYVNNSEMPLTDVIQLFAKLYQFFHMVTYFTYGNGHISLFRIYFWISSTATEVETT